MGLPDRQDDHVLSIAGLPKSDQISVCSAVSRGRSVAEALSECGRYMDDLAVALEEDPEFKREYEQAIAIRDDAIEAALHRKARKGNVTAIKFYLTNRRPQDWTETRTTRHVGHNGGPVTVSVTHALRDLITSEDTRESALAWIEAESREQLEAPDEAGPLEEHEDVEGGEGAPLPGDEPGEAG